MDNPVDSDSARLDQRLHPILQALDRFKLAEKLHHRQHHRQPEVEAALLRGRQDAELARRLLALDGADVAQRLEMLPASARHRVWRNLGHEHAGAALYRDVDLGTLFLL